MLQAERIAFLKSRQELSKDETLWWNKLKIIEEEELDLMPHSFIKKFGAYVNRVKENYVLNAEEESKAFENRWELVRDLESLKTDEKKQQLEDWKESNRQNPENTLDDINWDGYMTRQPRFDLRKHNFNFEQYDRYIHMYEDARAEDESKSAEFYKLVKYVQARKGTEAEHSDPMVINFLRKYKLDLIEIPEEFKDLEVEDDFKFFKKSRNVAQRRKRVLTKSSRDLTGYDAWRCFDRELLVNSGRDKSMCTIMVAPALLKRAFGTPSDSHIGFQVTGMYSFEDTNLDVYCIHDYKQTDLYHGFNREDSHYDTAKNMKKPERKRVRKWPSYEEFWASETPTRFRLLAGEQADWRTFKRWLFRHLRQIESQPDYDYDKIAMDMFGKDLDICLGDYDQKGTVNTEMAIFNFDAGMYYNKKEIAAMPDEKKPVRFTPPTMLDLKNVERVVIDKDKMKVQEIQAEQEKLSQFV